jgi:competence ComEA-like helix-hairpin-helix protein
MVLPSSNPSPAPQKPERFSAWPRPVQYASLMLSGFFLALLLMRGQVFFANATRPLEVEADLGLQFRIDLNEADRPTLLQVPGVGEKMADRILSYRETNGPFQNLQQLLQIQGFGSATLERLRPWIEVRSPSPARPVQVSVAKKQSLIPRVGAPAKAGPKAGGTSGKSDTLTGPIAINSATLEELQTLPRVGLKRAQQIVDERTKSPFRSIEDLRRIPGIGAKTLETLRPWIMLDKVEHSDIQVNSGNARSRD